MWWWFFWCVLSVCLLSSSITHLSTRKCRYPPYHVSTPTLISWVSFYAQAFLNLGYHLYQRWQDTFLRKRYSHHNVPPISSSLGVPSSFVCAFIQAATMGFSVYPGTPSSWLNLSWINNLSGHPLHHHHNRQFLFRYHWHRGLCTWGDNGIDDRVGVGKREELD